MNSTVIFRVNPIWNDLQLKEDFSLAFYAEKLKNHKMKVVIPSTACRHKKMVFSTPHDEFCISGHDIWGEGTSDRYLQAPKIYLVISHTCGQHALTKVVQKAKIDVFKQF